LKRRNIVSFYRANNSLREVAKAFHESKSTVGRWVKFASGQRLDRVDFSDQKSGTFRAANKSLE
jgi:transposase